MADELVFYTNPRSRGRIVRWMLEEIGQPYRTEVLDYGTTMKAPAYLAINPMGKVPALRHGDAVVTEAAAVCAYLADAFPQATGASVRRSAARTVLPMAVLRRRPDRGGGQQQGIGFVVPTEREGSVGYGSFDRVMEVLEDAVSTGELSRRRQLHRSRRLCRFADRLRPDVRDHGKTPGVRQLLAADQQPSRLCARKRTRQCPDAGAESGRLIVLVSAHLHKRLANTNDAPSRTWSDSVKVPGAKTIMVEPCSNRPSSSPLQNDASQAIKLGPRCRRLSSTSRKFRRMLATRIAATATRVTGSPARRQRHRHDRPFVLAEQPLDALERDRIDVPGVAGNVDHLDLRARRAGRGSGDTCSRSVAA